MSHIDANAALVAPETALGRAALTARFAHNADGIVEELAAKHGLTVHEAMRCLPESVCRWTAGERFAEVMADLSLWGEVLFLVHTPSIILEVKGEVPEGKFGSGFFNLHGESPIGGHVRAARCTEIAFVTRPFMGLASASVQFFDIDGGCMFKVYVARRADRSLSPSQLVQFTDLADRMCGELAAAS
jgi:putative heme utilization carrier protein HutX